MVDATNNDDTQTAPTDVEVAFEPDPAVQARIDAADRGGSEGSSGSARQKFKDEASKLGGQASEKIKAFAGEGKDRATDALDELANLLGKASEDVDAKLGEQFGGYARSASGAVKRFSDDVRGREIDDIVDDVSEFVKKSPGVAIGAAAAIGFVVARVLHSSIDAGRGSNGGNQRGSGDNAGRDRA